MKYMTGNEIRKAYLQFFKSKEHLILHSFPLIPENDPSLLLIGAGMAPLKPYFTGKLVPPSYRVTTSQKCIRTGDIDNVGRTARHHTFFEMLGNFSFGNYFKKEAISWAWEFLTEVLELDKSKLYVTIYPDDKEAYDYWHNMIGLADERIFKFDDNFWEIGEGPCGPDSEIFYDLGPERGCGQPTCNVGCDCDRYLEIWNLVFTQFNRTKDGKYEPLEKKNIDTGCGLERLASVIQQKESNFETDLIFPIIEDVIALCHGDYNDPHQKVAMKVIADHIRAITVMISDGILPSNEGRGYVLRRILRRAVRFGRLLGIKELFLSGLVDTVIGILGEEYPELKEHEELIKKVIDTEETQFSATLAQGTELLDQLMAAAGPAKELDGKDVFKLYDTYGFPVELTEEIASENGITIDHAGFDAAMKEQQERARAAREDVSAKVATPDTTRLDQSKLVNDPTAIEATVVMLGKEGVEVARACDGEEVTVIIDNNPFHPEGGGQLGDTGMLEGKEGKAVVTDARALPNGLVYLVATVQEGALCIGDMVDVKVDKDRNLAMARNHTATHLLQAALRKVLGNHVNQAGSLVTPDRLRFDFTHFEAISPEELRQVEELVNDAILEGYPVATEVLPIEEAKKKGAVAMFGEKYGETVRVVEMSDFSVEFCGGTHVDNTAKAGPFRIKSESSVASGVRRIEATCGKLSLKAMESSQGVLSRAAQFLKTAPSGLLERMEQQANEMKQLRQALEKFKAEASLGEARQFLASAKTVKDLHVLATTRNGVDTAELRTMGDFLRDKDPKAVAVIASINGEKITFLAVCGKEAVARGIKAGDLVRHVSAICGGKGGGKPDSAMGGGSDPLKVDDALASVDDFVSEKLG